MMMDHAGHLIWVVGGIVLVILLVVVIVKIMKK